MAEYSPLTEATVPAYVASRPELADLVDPASLEVTEIGDGNLNLVFRARDGSGRSVILKQALPYLRAAGEAWPLTIERAAAEARAYEAAMALSPSSVPEFHGYDAENHVLAMEDLAGWTVWRTALDAGEIHRGAEVELGRYLARLLMGTGVLGLTGPAFAEADADSANPALCRITEDLVFTEPYTEYVDTTGRRAGIPQYFPELSGLVAELRADRDLLDGVSALKYTFMTRHEALIHGDLHTGSVMVRLGGQAAPDGGPAPGDRRARAKAFDGEFCFYGPIAFDLGALFGNWLLALGRARALGRDEQAAWLETLPASAFEAFTAEFWRLWPNRVDQSFTEGFARGRLRRIEAEAIGFGGTKAIRRLIGFARTTDIDTLGPDERGPAAEFVLRTAARWVVGRDSLRVGEIMAVEP